MNLAALSLLRPTRFGWAFLGLTVLTLIGCINYGLSLGYGLTFLLSAVWVTGAAQARRLARSLSLALHAPAEATAAHPVTFSAQVTQTGGAGRVQVRGLVGTETVDAWAFLEGGETRHLPLTLPQPRRGPLTLRAEVFALDSFGLWLARSAAHAEAEALVAPAPEPAPPAPPTLAAAGEGDTGQRMSGSDDFAGLRPYAAGDAPRLISWRHAARTGQLVTREFDAPLGRALALDWAATSGDTEARLSRLAGWVALARSTQTPFRLSLPDRALPVGAGEGQVRAALHALALHPPLPAAPGEKPVSDFLARPAWLGGPAAPAVAALPLPTTPLQFSLLALGVALVPGLLRYPFWSSLLILGLLTYRGLQAEPARRLTPLPPLLLGVLAVGAGLGLNNHYGTLLGADGGTAILALLLALKAAETGTVRDARLLSLLGLFIVSTHFFHDQGPLTALHALLATTLLLSAAARWLNPQGGGPLLPRPLMGQTGRLLLLSLPMTVLLFVFFPRPDGPLWQLPVQQGARTGLADEITAGEFSNLAQSTEVAFRADFSGELPPQDELYWRGPVYENYDGERWTQARQRFTAPSVEPIAAAPLWTYTTTLEPSGKPWLLTLDVPMNYPRPTILTSGFQTVTLRPSGLRTRYDWQSRAARLGRIESSERLNFDLLLPAGQNPQALALAAQWRTLEPRQRVQAALEYLQNNNFSYTLSPPKLPAENRVDAFLFGTRQGFCEHYSSAFAVLMRAAGVPARVVGGYQGGEVNPNGGYLIVRQQNAHAWNEVWFEGEGWVRVDPTAAVAPARIRTDLTTALAQPRAAAPLQKTRLEQLKLRFDALQNQWNTWVASYDGEQQRSLLSRLGVRDTTSPLYLLGLLALAGLLLLPALAFLRRTARPRDPALLALYTLTQRLGLPRAPGETPTAYVQRAAAQSPEQAELLRAIVQTFNRLRYGREPGADTLATLREQVRRVRRVKG
ncbi:transglutaminaseTgpA domain-containing protein [Deinococcus sp. VB343]|uniref:TransglutaminaseTgpA domain-containing protein n=1 Tax=Deinococcus sp. VB142 TaxID=3112952 RepID=A0AAU6Q094_9DEIO